MYIAPSLVEQAITKLSEIRYAAGRTKGHKDSISMLLLVLRAGANASEWKSKEELFASSETYLDAIYELGGLFDSSETPGKRACLFFSSFYQKDELETSDFYNQATSFNRLFGRVKDTIDNSVADYIFDRGEKDSYRLRRDYIQNVVSMYGGKFLLDALVIWCYRHRNIGNKTLAELRADFLYRYKILKDADRELFDVSNKFSMLYSSEPITGTRVRELLNASASTEILSLDENDSFNFIFNKPSAESGGYFGSGFMLTPEQLYNVLERNKQVILTGVPGTGKSYMLEEISNNFATVKKVQFHQSYTYQDFVYGKTLNNGSVVGTIGDLLKFIKECESLGDNQKGLLILDEINRGNISSIFGELLYALDRDKEIHIDTGIDDEELAVILPDNLYIAGTMNTADRSIALVDFAIRRRFMFVNLEPNYAVVDANSVYKQDLEIFGNLLKKINDKIVEQFDNEEYRLGHSYFIRSGKRSWDDDDLYETLHYKVFPMIVEYAHGSKKPLRAIFGETLIEANKDELIHEIEHFLE